MHNTLSVSILFTIWIAFSLELGWVVATFELPSWALGIDWNGLLSGLIGAIVGGLIAAVSTMRAASRSATEAFNYSRSLQDEADREATKRFLLAIQAEVTTVWDSYRADMGQLIENVPKGEALDVIYNLRQHYFTVYDSNAQFLGHVEDDELRMAIVKTYTLMKGLMDSHSVMNDLLSQMQNLSALDPQTDKMKKMLDHVISESEAFSPKLTQSYKDTDQSVQDLRRLFERFGLPDPAAKETKQRVQNVLELLKRVGLPAPAAHADGGQVNVVASKDESV